MVWGLWFRTGVSGFGMSVWSLDRKEWAEGGREREREIERKGEREGEPARERESETVAESKRMRVCVKLATPERNSQRERATEKSVNASLQDKC